MVAQDRSPLTSALLCLLLCAGGASSVEARQVSVTVIAPPDSPPAEEGEVWVVAVPTGGLGEVAVDREAALATVGEPTRLELVEGVWTLAAVCDGFWSPPRILTITAAGTALDLELHLIPAATVTFPVVAPPPSGPSQAVLTFSHSVARPSFKEASVPCTEGPVPGFQCEVPRERLNLKLVVPGFAPVYWWDVLVTPALRMPPARLARGASVSGHLVTDSDAPASRIRVSLRSPSGAAIPSGDATHDPEVEPAAALEATSDSRGFFQITSVPPGQYLLQARSAGGPELVSAEGQVVVSAELEYQLRQPLRLGAPLSMSVHLLPATSPTGTPWLLDLVQAESDRPPVPIARRSAATTSGIWEWDVLPEGTYFINVSDDQGRRWHSEALEFAAGSESFLIEVTASQVRGRVTLGDEPLQATLVFGGRSGAMRIPAESSDDGLYAVLVPDELLERFEKAIPVYVTALDPPLTRSLNLEARREADDYVLDVELPNGGIAGRLLGPDRGPWRETAVVTARALLDTEERIQVVVEPTETAEFRLEGLDAGQYAVGAASRGAESAEVLASVSEDSRAEGVDLVLEGATRVQGVVRDPLGQPVAGAMVRVVTPAALFRGSPRTVTGADGTFELSIPSQANELVVSVSAVGLAYKMLRREVPPQDTELAITLPALGGTLRLAYEDRLMAQGESTYLMNEEGAFLAARLLEQWSSMQGASSPSFQEPDSHLSGELLVPQIEAGEYSICRVAEADFLRFLSRDARLLGRCATGELRPGEELLLVVPPSGLKP